MAGWGLLADFCFADLLLFGVAGDPRGRRHRFVVLGQVRPTTSQTVYRADWIGTVLEEDERPLVARAYPLGEIIEGETTVSRSRSGCGCCASPSATGARSSAC